MSTEDQLNEERQQKIVEYEAFVNERLKPDLDYTLTRRDKIYNELAQYLELRAHIGLINSKELKKMTTMVDVGSECFVQAKIEDTSRIFVHVGMGFHAEMTLDEALKFITSKEAELNAKADKITEEAAAIKDKIRMVYETLDWLMQIPESARPRREMF